MRTRLHPGEAPSFRVRFSRSLTTVAVAAAVLLLTSCGSRQTAETSPAPENGEEEYSRFTAAWPRGSVVPIEIDNRHTLDLTIYIMRSGKSQRIGMATAAGSTFLRLPAHHLGPGNELTLMAHAIGAARRLQSERLVVMPGQKVVWTIDHGFDTASSAVWE